MQCDESEFLEIMSLVGMLPKPLHVRRLQRALTEFSKDQASFNLAAIQQIGPPPVSPYTIGSADVSFLLPGLAATLTNLSSTSPGLATSTDSTSPSNGAAHNSVSLALDLSSHVLGSVASTGSIGATANVVRGELLQSIAGNGQPGSGATKEKEREVLDLMSLPVKSPNRLDEYRKYSAIYGRFDTKRKPDKVLSLHEVSVNEAAAQLCLLMPSLLTRRDELFPLARQVVKDAGYHYAKTTRKRAFDLMETHSPNSSPSESPPPGLAEEQDAEQTPNYRTTSAFTHLSEEKRRKTELFNNKIQCVILDRGLQCSYGLYEMLLIYSDYLIY
uniref:NGFI-A binding protein 2 (EGR1 binding protein 2) n=1 Tax=Heterorhabditis bacteriophora TaxID=37862 RepID=A0A1I7XDZ9_HETBA